MNSESETFPYVPCSTPRRSQPSDSNVPLHNRTYYSAITQVPGVSSCAQHKREMHTYPNSINPRARVELVAFGKRRGQAHDHAAALVEYENGPKGENAFAEFDCVAWGWEKSAWSVGIPDGSLDLVKAAVHRCELFIMKKVGGDESVSETTKRQGESGAERETNGHTKPSSLDNLVIRFSKPSSIDQVFSYEDSRLDEPCKQAIGLGERLCHCSTSTVIITPIIVIQSLHPHGPTGSGQLTEPAPKTCPRTKKANRTSGNTPTGKSPTS